MIPYDVMGRQARSLEDRLSGGRLIAIAALVPTTANEPYHGPPIPPQRYAMSVCNSKSLSRPETAAQQEGLI
jgi:hypothetical protein